jgi:hypothetical protein
MMMKTFRPSTRSWVLFQLICGSLCSLLLQRVEGATPLTSPKERVVPRLAPSTATKVRVIEPAPMPPEALGRVGNPADYPHSNQSAASAAAASYPTNIALTWNGSTSPLVTGYNVYRGTNSRTYTTSFFTPGTNATYLLVLGKTNFFSVTAIDSAGSESDFSNEVSYRSVEPPPPVTNFAIITWGSSNMTTWKNVATTIVTNSEPFLFYRQQIIKIVP